MSKSNYSEAFPTSAILMKPYHFLHFYMIINTAQYFSSLTLESIFFSTGQNYI